MELLTLSSVFQIDMNEVIFRELTPKSANEEAIFHCEYCGTGFQWKKSLFRHIRNKHKDSVKPIDLPEEVRDEVTCKMCRVKILRSEVKRHLRRVHHVPDCQPGYVLHGFVSYDNEETWFPVFAPNGVDVLTLLRGVTAEESDDKVDVNVRVADMELGIHISCVTAFNW